MDLETINYRKKLLDDEAKHRSVTGRSSATIGKLIANDGRFFDRIRAGKGCTVDTFQKAVKWFRVNTPSKKKLRSE